MTATSLEAERVFLRHDGVDRDAVRDVTLRVEPGEILALVGPNGSGKSTLLAGLGRQIQPRSGVVRFDGEDARRIRTRALARRMARLPQDPACPEGLTVDALVHMGRHPYQRFGHGTSVEDERAVRDAIVSMELQDMRSRGVDTLSGGERRRAWIAMVLAQRPEVLLLDEPTAALDLRHQWQVLDLLVQVNRTRGTTLVISIHDLEQAARIADRVAVLYRGRLYAVGAPEKILGEETLLDVFGVESRVLVEDEMLYVRVQGPGDPLRSL